MIDVRIAGLVLLAACDGASIAGASADADAGAEDRTEREVPTPTPWVFDAGSGEPTPELDPETLVAVISDTAQALRSIDARALHDVHDAIVDAAWLAQGGPNGCPYVLDYGYGTLYWQGECTADDGTRFLGLGVVSEDYQSSFYRYLSGRVVAPDGTWIEGAGEVSYDEYGGLTVIESFVAGGPRAPVDPWFDGSRSLRLRHTYEYRPSSGGAINAFDVALRAPDLLPEGVDAVVFDALTFMNEAGGAYCYLEPGGGAAVRTADGGWYEIAFDGRTLDVPEEELALCDGCGRTTFRGQTLAPTCLDPAPFFSPPAPR